MRQRCTPLEPQPQFSEHFRKQSLAILLTLTTPIPALDPVPVSSPPVILEEEEAVEEEGWVQRSVSEYRTNSGRTEFRFCVEELNTVELIQLCDGDIKVNWMNGLSWMKSSYYERSVVTFGSDIPENAVDPVGR